MSMRDRTVPQPVAGAEAIARILKARGIERVFALCGGHIMPIWMALDEIGIEIIGMRDERSAVFAAHAHAMAGGRFGVALVTAGPGVTNAMTGIANAHVSRVPLLILSGTPPVPQENRGALQDVSHTALVASVTRYARTVRHPHAIPREIDAAISSALGIPGEPGPSFVDVPVDIQRDIVPEVLCQDEHLRGGQRPRTRPTDHDIEEAAAVIAAARRPLVIAGRGANAAPSELSDFLTASGAAYLDTGETRGLVPESHPSHVAAMRARAMSEADLVVTIGRKLDFQLAYGSPAVFPGARLLRISDVPQELIDNRPGSPALLGDIPETLKELSKNLLRTGERNLEWVAEMRAGHDARTEKLEVTLASAPDDAQGRMHPNRLLAALRLRIDPGAVLIADGGDLLSFARVALSARTYLDPGPLGCIGIATPFALGAAMAAPGRQVVAVTGDGAFGFSAIEIDTIARYQVPVMIVIGNNRSWAIEVTDQKARFGRDVSTTLQDANHARMAEAFGMAAIRIETASDLEAGLDEAFRTLAAGMPVLVDVVISEKAVSADGKSGLARVPDHQALDAWDRAERTWLGLPQE